MISRLLQIICLFCRILSLLYGTFAKETCIFKEPTNRSHPYLFAHDCSRDEIWLTHVSDMTHSCLWPYTFKDICPRDVYVSMRISVCTYLFICRDMTHSCGRHYTAKEFSHGTCTSRITYLYAHIYSHICMHWSIHISRYDSFMVRFTYLFTCRDMTHPCFRHYRFKDIDPRDVYVSMQTSVCTYLFTCWDMTHSCLRHNSLKEIHPGDLYVSILISEKICTYRYLYIYINMYIFMHMPRYDSSMFQT